MSLTSFTDVALELGGQQINMPTLLKKVKDSKDDALREKQAFTILEHRKLLHDFKKALGLESNQVSGYLQKVITHGRIVSNTIKPVWNRMGFERVYSYQGNYYIVTGIGTNVFIVSAYPHKKGGK